MTGQALPPVADDSLQDRDHGYQLVGGQWVDLLDAVNEAIVRFDPELNLRGLLDRLQASQGRAFESIASIEREDGKSLALIRTTDGGEIDLPSMNKVEGIIFAYPALVSEGRHLRVLPQDQILIRLEEGADLQDVAQELEQMSVTVLEQKRSGTVRCLLEEPKEHDPLVTSATLFDHPDVKWTQPNFLRELEFFQTPNDPLFDQQQHLHNTGQNNAVSDADVDAPAAWNTTTGHQEIVVAVLDTGVDLSHPDLRIYSNPGETGNGKSSNGIDDDGNGYVDDHQGWDFDGWASPDNDPSDHHGHGTSVAGIAAAIGDNNEGGAGIAYDCTMLPVKISTDGGDFPSDSTLADAIRYAAEHADVLNGSWGIGSSSEVDSALQDVTTSGRGGKGTPVFFATGNAASNWMYGGGRLRLPISKLNLTSGDYRFGFYYERGSTEVANERILVDHIALLDGDRYTHIGTTSTSEDFEGSTINWYNHQNADGNWAPDNNYQLDGTGSTTSAISPNLGADGEWGLYYSDLMTLDGDETWAFAQHLHTDSSAIFATFVYDSSGNLVTNVGWQATVNNIDTSTAYPASNSDVIAVGASTDFDYRGDYSQYGGNIFCVAPSAGGWNDTVTTSLSDGYTKGFGGTSSASPLAAGIAALALSKNGDLTETDVRNALESGADKIGGVSYDSNGWHSEYGYGRVNADATLASVSSDTTSPGLTNVVIKHGRAIEVTFDEKMGDASSTSYYSLSGTGQGGLSSTPDSVARSGWQSYMLRWDYGEMDTSGSDITVTVGSGAQDIAGNGVGAQDSGSSTDLTRKVYRINCGKRYSHEIWPFDSDRYYSGAGDASGPHGLDSISDTDPAPDYVYRTDRAVLAASSDPGDILYTLWGITGNVDHTVRLYFMDSGYYGDEEGAVVFDVYINGNLVLYNFDLIAEAGGSNIGISRSFSNIQADSLGRIRVKVVPNETYSQTYDAYYYNATISGIDVTAQ